jgi:hypothetical protein
MSSIKDLSEEEFLATYKGGKELNSILNLQNLVLDSYEKLKLNFESFCNLHSDYLHLCTNALLNPHVWDNDLILFHVKNYFLLFICVADQYFFLQNGRMVGLNAKSDKNLCATRKDYFNHDYAKDSNSKSVSLSDCSREGYAYHMQNFIKPIKKAAHRVPKVIQQQTIYLTSCIY